jgi:hypothetical protein
MGLNDLISTPFGQPMSAGRRQVGRRSSRLFRQSEKAGGESTAEGRRIRGLGGRHLLAEGEGTQRPEKSALIEMGDELKLAIASGGLDPIKDIKPLQGNFFGHLQASNLSPEEKEGIRTLFADPFDELAKKQEDAEDRRLQRKQFKVGVKKAKQDIERGDQIQKAAAIDIENAEEKQRERAAGVDKRADFKRFLKKINKAKMKAIEFDDLNANIRAQKEAGDDADILDSDRVVELAAEGIRSDQDLLQSLNSWMANNPDILYDQRSTAQISAIGNLLGADKEWQRKVELSDRSYERGLKTTVVQQAIAAGLDTEKLDLEEMSGIELADALIKQNHKKNENALERANNLEQAKVFRDVAQQYQRIASLAVADFPSDRSKMSQDINAFKSKVKNVISFLTSLKDNMAIVSPESPLVDEDNPSSIDAVILDLEKDLSGESYIKEGDPTKVSTTPAFGILDKARNAVIIKTSEAAIESTRKSSEKAAKETKI